MTGFNYAKTRAAAERLISKFGQGISVISETRTGPQYNPTVTQTAHAATAAVMDFAFDEIDGTLIQRGDKRVYLSTQGLNITLSTAHKLRIGGIDHSIVSFKALAPAGVIVFWEVQARK